MASSLEPAATPSGPAHPAKVTAGEHILIPEAEARNEQRVTKRSGEQMPDASTSVRARRSARLLFVLITGLVTDRDLLFRDPDRPGQDRQGVDRTPARRPTDRAATRHRRPPHHHGPATGAAGNRDRRRWPQGHRGRRLPHHRGRHQRHPRQHRLLARPRFADGRPRHVDDLPGRRRPTGGDQPRSQPQRRNGAQTAAERTAHQPGHHPRPVRSTRSATPDPCRAVHRHPQSRQQH